ncbi:MAG: hypothetical protein IPF67_19295 [Saprospiraceae bacterium]|nr:hypothetical protein [Candidatus Brachybacter algidus]
MAIYQYYLAFIPKIGILKKHEVIPNQIEISKETEYFEANTDEYWELAQVTFHEIKLEIDKIVEKANWGNKMSVLIGKLIKTK